MSRPTNTPCNKSRAGRALALAWLTLLAGLAGAATVDIDRIAAVVNNSVITRYEVEQRVGQVTRQLRGQNTRLPPLDALRKQVLERLITETVMRQIAQDLNVRIEDSQLDRAIAGIAQRNRLDVATFRKTLEAEGTPFAEFREQIRAEMLTARLREREVDNRVLVTDAEIDNYLNSAQRDERQQDEYLVAHILVYAPEGASAEQLGEARARVDKARDELLGGAPFESVSAAYSGASNALQGGKLGWRGAAQLPDLFVEALTTMRVGEVSPVLRSPNGFHLLKLLDKRGKDVRTVLKQTRANHILIKVNEVVSDDDARNRLLQLKERVENGESFADLARLHSDDLSASKGGELGWLTPGDTVPEFERAMDALEPGGLSEPVRSPFGWHLIQVLERRDQDVTQERRRLDARRALRERKAEEAFDDWLRQARDRAYVEYREDDD